MDFIGLAGALLIGIILAVIGSGGSILTLPILVYIMGIEPVYGTAYSLFIVGITAVTGSIEYARKKLIDFRAAFIFALPALVAVYFTRLYIVPALPDPLFSVAGTHISKGMGIMLLFAVLMFAASVSMIRQPRVEEKKTEESHHFLLIILEGVVVGLLTGLVGAGGGFLIIPALVLLGNIPMKKAVGTSLLIIAVKSLLGFTGDMQNLEIDWFFLIYFSAFTISGIFAGSYLSHYISGNRLKPLFGWFLLLMGVIIISRELFL